MATPVPPPAASPPRKIRISQVADRYLVFDLSDVMQLRRTHGICSVLVGTIPQAPNQNVFSGLPLELLAEEARLLRDKGAAVIVDEARAHLDRLKALSLSSEEGSKGRRDYVESHRAMRAAAQRSLDEELAARTAAVVKARDGGKKGKGKKRAAAGPEESAAAAVTSASTSTTTTTPSEEPEGPEIDLFNGTPSAPARESKAAAPPSSASNARHVALTPTTSSDLLLGAVATPSSGDGDVSKTSHQHNAPPFPCPLFARLNAAGYFMTPGIRFGGCYSVYPGDPFRFHAHFIADSYGWDEEIDMLDLVGTGRLAGAVKKGLLIGAEDPDGEGAGEADGRSVRAFSVEWAAM